MNEGGSNSVVESQPSKLLVAGSIPVSRSSLRLRVIHEDALRLGRLTRSTKLSNGCAVSEFMSPKLRDTGGQEPASPKPAKRAFSAGGPM